MGVGLRYVLGAVANTVGVLVGMRVLVGLEVEVGRGVGLAAEGSFTKRIGPMVCWTDSSSPMTSNL